MIYNDLNCFTAASMKRYFRFGVLSFLLVLTASAAASGKTPNARKQIQVAVQLNAAEVIYQEARRRQWPNYQADLNLFIPSEVSRFATCAKEPTVSFPDGERIDLIRLRVDVRCESPQRWDVAVTVKPDIYLPVVVAQNTLERGHLLSPSDVAIKKLNISSLRGNYLTNPDEVMGLTVKRRVRERQAIALTQLESPVLVERGQRVLMIAEQGGVEARTMGEAMKKGRKGEMIKVKNESSERVVSAIVAESGVVKMVYASGR
ncbi:flagellar basal body P-ring formation chaperone FlgA [Pseudocitrobacter cyperus]|uniref:Flagella basal body P-ring formation protein FlgA n=1 Tax=Pseudocitrobacter cyperus TaxID=3112843 RepID=A0ABV0HII7_9ENTR